MLLKCSKELCTFIVAFWNWKPNWTNLEKGKTKKVMLFSTRYLFLIVSQKYFWHFFVENRDMKSFRSFASWVCCGSHTSIDDENVQPPPCYQVRVFFSCSLCVFWNSISIVYHVTVCSCVKTRVNCVTRYISRRQVTWPKVEAIIRQNNTSTTSKILESQKQWNSFKAIKDIVMIIPSKNNGILRIIEAKFDGEKRRNLQHTAEFAKWPRLVNLSVLYIGRFACSVM